MPDLADLFPGYASEWIDTSSGRLFARVGGSGPPLLLLHGFSSTHVMWHRVAPQLAEHFTLIIADLPGYGWSDMPESDDGHTPYTKRAMAQAVVEAMQQLGHVHFALAGHDRGGRVGYRLAFDHPGRLSRLAVLDILPTYDYWERMNRRTALKIYHWSFLAQPFPLPETLIDGHGEFFLRHKMASQTRSKISTRSIRARCSIISRRSAIPPACMPCARITAPAPMPITTTTRRTSRLAARSPSRCWRYGATPASPARRRPRSRPGSNGRPICRAPRSKSGHFLPEENPAATATALQDFFMTKS